METFDNDDFRSACNETFSIKEGKILEKNRNFFSQFHAYFKEFLLITNFGNIIRIIDWFLENYSKKHNIHYGINESREFYVYDEYQIQLNNYTRLYFDPFCRNKKIFCKYQDEEKEMVFLSSIGQINFFRWAIENGVIKYVKIHLNEIKDDMISKK